MVFKQFVASILFFIFFSIAIAAAESPQELLKQYCTPCHSLNLVYSVKKTQAEWEKTVDRMITYGAQLDEQERRAVIEYLSEK